MALNDISLTAGMRSNLISLQNTTTLLDRTQSRLSTGKKVNTALDNPTNFFAAQNHTQRAADLTTRKDGMAEAIQGVRAANDGITGITALIEAAKGLTQSARSADRTGRDNLADQFNTVLSQITQLAGDSGYKGKNFLKGDSLQVLFNENGGSFLTIQGFSATSAGLSITSVTVGTADIVTTGLSAGTGSAVAATAVHDAALNTGVTPGYVATGFFFGNLAGTAPATGGTGLFTVDFNAANFHATGMTYSGVSGSSGMSVAAVYVTTGGGTSALTGGAGTGGYTITGTATVGSFVIEINTGVATTGATITYDLSVYSHLSGTDNAAPANRVVWDLATGDLGSGLSVTGLAATGANHVSGLAVYISGQYVATDNYTISGNQIIFSGLAVPPQSTGDVTYNYNTGFSAVSGANLTITSSFSGVTLGALQSITAVKVDGVLQQDNYTISGNLITFNTGSEPANGAVITYTLTTNGSTGEWASDLGIDSSVTQLDTALNTLRTQSAALASNLSVVSIRQDFTSNLVNDLLKGADNLTLADTNEEGANMLMLQTRQQLSTTSLKMASDAAQAVLRLF